MRKKKQASAQFEDRVRFNWGFHDAAFDLRETKRGFRQLVEVGDQTTDQVSKTFDEAYYWGYAYGMKFVTAGRYENNSEPAWIEFKKFASGAGARFVGMEMSAKESAWIATGV